LKTHTHTHTHTCAQNTHVDTKTQMQMHTQDRIDEVQRSLTRSKLPLGAKAKEPKAVADYQFYRDAKDSKVFWDFRKVRVRACWLVSTAVFWWGGGHVTRTPA